MGNSFGPSLKLFLVTTANEEFWDRERKIIFLSEGCKLYSKRKSWGPLDHETFQFCLDTADKIESALDMYHRVYEKALIELCRVLNQFHQLDKDIKYYTILLGPWLGGFISQLCEKYLVLKEFQKFFPEFEAWLLSEDQRRIPLDQNEFYAKLSTDEYVLQIYSQILEFLGYRFQCRKLKNASVYPSVFVLNQGLSPRVIGFISSFHRRLNSALGRRSLILTYPYCSKKALLSFIVKSRFKYVLDEFFYPVKIPVRFDLNSREAIKINLGNSEFEDLLSNLLLKHLPFIYFEGFGSMRKIVKKIKDFNEEIYFTGIGLHANSLYALFLAEKAWHVNILIHQHGAGYGALSDSIVERFERGVADRFYTWGWKGGKCRVLPHPKICGPWKKNGEKKGAILILQLSPRYMTKLVHRAEGASFLKKYLEPLLVFLDAIREDIDISIKPHFLDLEWKIACRIKDRYPERNLKILSGNLNLTVPDAKISIHANPMGTPFLETLGRDIPTIGFFDPDLHKFRSEAQKNFDDLVHAEIIHPSPKQAAQKLNQVFDEVEAWWSNPSIQEARSTFVHRFARTSENWQADWIKEFDEVAERGV